MKATVLVGSSKKEKLNAVRTAFEEKFTNVEIISCNVSSQVRDQPIGLDETINGATNRKNAAKEQIIENANKEFLFAVGIENGIIPFYEREFCMDQGVIVLEHISSGIQTISCAASLPIPLSIKKEWTEADVELNYSKVWKTVHIKGKDWYEQMTMDTIGREQVLKEAVLIALGQILYRQSITK